MGEIQQGESQLKIVLKGKAKEISFRGKPRRDCVKQGKVNELRRDCVKQGKVKE
jgi:hypothetical protein